jgi:polysaccharide pyruvyl transferase WcaK-like protein
MKKLVKERLYSTLLHIYVSALRVLRTLRRGSGTDSSALILPPYSPGSLGDEAVLTTAVKQLTAHGMKRIGLISYRSDDDWQHLAASEILVMEDYFSFGAWKDRFRFARAVSRYDRFYLFGTDVMDGFYGDEDTVRRIALVALAAETGARATVAGFSFNERPTPASVKALRELPSSVRLCSRDPISYERVTQHLQRPVALVADIAFLLEPAPDSKRVAFVLPWICEQKSNHRTIVGINVNHLLLRQVPGLEPERIVQAHASAMVELYSKCDHLSFLMVPHDTRETINDATLASAVLEALPSEMAPHCLQVPTPCRAAEIKAICAELDIVLSGKMHLAIACLGQGTPVACITYQGKFEGLFQHFELDGMTITPEQALRPGKLSEFFLPLIEKRENLRRHIQSQLPRIQALARANLEPAG